MKTLKDKIIEAINAEPELPGEIPNEIFLAAQDKESLTELLRITVRETKKGIRDRILSRLKDEGEPESNELHPCPYSIAVRCTMVDPCLGCETWAKYKAGEEISRLKSEGEDKPCEHCDEPIPCNMECEQSSGKVKLPWSTSAKDYAAHFMQSRELTDEEWLKLPKEEILQLYKNCYAMLKNYIGLSGEKVQDVKTETTTCYSLGTQFKPAEQSDKSIISATNDNPFGAVKELAEQTKNDVEVDSDVKIYNERQDLQAQFRKPAEQSDKLTAEIPADIVTKMQKEFEPSPDTSFKQGMYSGYAFGLQDGYKFAHSQFEEKVSKKRKGYYCSICHDNPVDAENGYDTCQECLSKQ